MPRAGWWRMHDGTAVNLDQVAFVVKDGNKSAPGIGFHPAPHYKGGGWLDEYPSEAERDKAFETLMSLLPAAGVKYGRDK